MGRIRFQRVRLQTPNSVSFLALTEFRGENSVSSSQPIICVPKANSLSFSQNSPSLPQNSVRLSEFFSPKEFSRNNIPQPFPKKVHPDQIGKKCIYIYIYAGEPAGCPPFSCWKASWLSTWRPAGCPPSVSHYKNRGFWTVLGGTAEMRFCWNLRLWRCWFACISCVVILGGLKKRLGVSRLWPLFPSAWLLWCYRVEKTREK